MHKFLSLLLLAGLSAAQPKTDAAAIEQRELFRTENWKTSSPDIVCRTGEAGIRMATPRQVFVEAFSIRLSPARIFPLGAFTCGSAYAASSLL